MERIIVIGGKGGVGKSSISAATALKLSELLPDKKVLIISFDMAHNISDLFLKEIGNKITRINNNLWGIEPDPNIYAEEYTRNLLRKMKDLMKQMPFVGFIPQIENFIDTTFTTDSIPLALKNAMFFQKILDAEDLTKDIQFDIVVADFPPTANMITLFEIPEDQVKIVLKYSLNFFNSVKKAIRRISKVFSNIINPPSDSKKRRELGEDVLKMIQELEKRGEKITQLIHDIGSLRLVSIAEKPSFEEIKRARKLTNKYIDLEGIHINMLTPENYAENCEFCENLRSIQLNYSKEIKEEFKNFKIWSSEKLSKEPIGYDGLAKLANEIYGNKIKAEEILYPKV